MGKRGEKGMERGKDASPEHENENIKKSEHAITHETPSGQPEAQVPEKSIAMDENANAAIAKPGLLQEPSELVLSQRTAEDIEEVRNAVFTNRG